MGVPAVVRKAEPAREGPLEDKMNSRVCICSVVVLVMTCACAVALAFPEETPVLLHSAVLNGVVVDPDTGNLRVDRVQAAYLPEPPNGSHEPKAEDPARRLWAVLSTAEGTEVARLDFWTERLDAPMWLLGAYTVSTPGQPDQAGQQQIKLEPGDYVLDFHLSGGRFYTFPFSVKVVGEKYLVSGDWNSWGYLLYAGADPEEALVWKVWLRRNETGNRDGVDTRVEIVREKDGKVVATSRPDMRQYLRDGWVRYSFDLIHPMQGTSGGAYMKAADLLSQDGAYQLKMTVDGAKYGTWKFQVTGGKLRLAGRADRETADPLTFVYGGKDAFWYKSDTAAQADPGAMKGPERTFTQKGMIPDCRPVVVNGTTLVPVRPVATFLEAQVQWDAGSKTMVVTHGERTLRLTVGKTEATANGAALALGVAPVEREGEVCAPARAMVEALGAELEWDAATRLLTIIDGDRAGMIYVPR